jgi:hypothetical protein
VKKKAPLGIHFKFPDRSEQMPLTDYEEHLLRQSHELARSHSPVLQQIGEAQLRREAERRGHERVAAAKRKKSGELGAQERRVIGERTAKRVEGALAERTDPHVGERHVRRIKNRLK